jgi:branched-chain amino acid transport system ATP-binding protein
MMLEVEGLAAGYGPVQVLYGVGFGIGDGEIVSLLGRNGMGKTTTVRAILGLIAPSGGSIRFRGEEIAGDAAYRIARRGIGLVPEGRLIFPTLTVRENLVATAANRTDHPDPWTIEKIFGLFPVLAERRHQPGGSLSGGEQQMLAIGRALMTNPLLLVLDEATEGLAPMVRREIYRCVGLLKRNRQSILIIDKHVEELARVADRHVIIEKGRSVWTGDGAAFVAEPALRKRYLGV